jgi:hypothetical protein
MLKVLIAVDMVPPDVVFEKIGIPSPRRELPDCESAQSSIALAEPTSDRLALKPRH